MGKSVMYIEAFPSSRNHIAFSSCMSMCAVPTCVCGISSNIDYSRHDGNMDCVWNVCIVPIKMDEHRNSCRQKRQSASHFSAEHSHKWEREKWNTKRKWMQSFILKAFSGLPTQKIHLFDGFKPLCILLGGSVASRIPRGQFFPDFSGHPRVRWFRRIKSDVWAMNLRTFGHSNLFGL